MSIKKFKPEFDIQDGNLKHTSKPFTTILNKVLQNCRNSDALALFCMLESRPENWKISIQNIKNHFGWTAQKVSRAMNFLIENNLMKKYQLVNDTGKFQGVEYELQDGQEFVIIQYDEDETVGVDYPQNRSTHDGNTQRGNLMTTNKRNTNKKEKTKKREKKSSRSFYELKKQKPSHCPGTLELISSSESKKIAIEKKLDEEKIGLIFMAHAKSEGWVRVDWKQAFIKWILNERNIESNSKNNEIKSTVGFWDSLKVKEKKADKDIARKNIKSIKEILATKYL
jgi:hypothetical protein